MPTMEETRRELQQKNAHLAFPDEMAAMRARLQQQHPVSNNLFTSTPSFLGFPAEVSNHIAGFMATPPALPRYDAYGNCIAPIYAPARDGARELAAPSVKGQRNLFSELDPQQQVSLHSTPPALPRCPKRQCHLDLLPGATLANSKSHGSINKASHGIISPRASRRRMCMTPIPGISGETWVPRRGR